MYKFDGKVLILCFGFRIMLGQFVGLVRFGYRVDMGYGSFLWGFEVGFVMRYYKDDWIKIVRVVGVIGWLCEILLLYD